MEANGQVLEITLISAQGLMKDSAKGKGLKTYALTWIDPDHKLRTQIDGFGGPNPTWNARFIFKVRPEFLASETSAISVEIYSVRLLRNRIIGSVRFLTSNFLPESARSGFIAPMKTPSFTALQIRRPSGSFHGILNIAAMVLDGSNVPALKGIGASCLHHRDLSGDGGQERRQRLDIMMPKSMRNTLPVRLNDVESSENNSVAESWDGSDEGGSTSSSSPPAASTALKDWNGVARVLSGKNHVRAASEGGRILCGLPMRKKMFM